MNHRNWGLLWLPLLGSMLAGCPDGDARRVPVGSVGSALTARPTAELRGRVTDDSGEPIEGAVLLVASTRDGRVPAELDPDQLFSAADGSFALTLPQDTYELTAVAPDATDARALVTLGEAGARIELTAQVDEQRLRDWIERGPDGAQSGEAQ